MVNEDTVRPNVAVSVCSSPGVTLSVVGSESPRKVRKEDEKVKAKPWALQHLEVWKSSKKHQRKLVSGAVRTSEDGGEEGIPGRGCSTC